jgi:hypothetical protein
MPDLAKEYGMKCDNYQPQAKAFRIFRYRKVAMNLDITLPCYVTIGISYLFV